MSRLRRLGSYDLAAELPAGSLGRRFRTFFGYRPACIEVTSVSGEQELFDRSLRRIEIMATIEHPNLVPILDAGLDNDQLYLVTPEPDRTAESIEPMGVQAVSVLSPVAQGLHQLHKQQWFHRDLQLRHIGWYDGVVKLGGFGLADLRGDGRTEGVGPIGGVLTMAPSLVRGAPATVGSDVFSLGAALHLLATGDAVHPLRTESLADRIGRIGSDAPTLSPLLPAKLIPLVTAALAADGVDNPEPNPLVDLINLNKPKHSDRPRTEGNS
jgi:serine/threonine protein kinase